MESLAKKAVRELIQESGGEVQELLKLRLLMAKTSVKKYEAIERSVCSDGRVHGLLQFYGANRTGRWAGRLVQVQNLPQNHLPDLELARKLVKNGRFEEVELLYESIPDVLSELIRTAFIPKEDYRYLVADFSAIEARVLAWLSGEQWRLEVFATHGKIYEASASAMFHVPIEEVTKGSSLRQKGKISELALGYGGAAGALISMGAMDMGNKEEELSSLVSTWRRANPHITQFWWEVDKAAIQAVTEKKRTKAGRIMFEYYSGILFVILPSGRKLSYVKPRMEMSLTGED
ncbi:DNA polymerase [Lacrimispora saccharolytica]|uniref:DNA polymerase n=1 Tax=Lacrimispora saccharolytica TaxID=84030 RepID=UPI0002EDFE2C|nr:DNA polymerase [Lacrimispora saccharolytica]